jgi:hypothetical protein
MEQHVIFVAVRPVQNIGVRILAPSDTDQWNTHWMLVFVSGTTTRAIQLMSPDAKTIRIDDHNIDPETYNEMPMYHVATYEGKGDDLDRVLRHHPMRSGKYSATFNNCQHYSANFLILLEALAKKSEGRYFEGSDLYRSIVDGVTYKDESETFIWNSPNFFSKEVAFNGVVLLPVKGVVTGATTFVAKATVTTVIRSPFWWLGAPSTTVIKRQLHVLK